MKQVFQKQQQQVSLTPAQRVEKHSGRLPPTEARSLLDNYQFKELLGKGASASVYRAINLITSVEVAVKQIEINSKDNVDLMMTEIRLLKILKHRNIVKYHGYVNTGTTLNIILEYCSGGSLRKLYKLRGRGLDEQEIIKYTREILSGLVYLHEQGVIHRDVKAANVLLTNSGTVKLADFGVSSLENHKSSLVVGGSPYWMAPEVILLQGSSTLSDIWSLGATVVELFTTQPPYHELDPMALCHAIGILDSPPIPPQIPKLAKEFLEECFQKSLEIRIDGKRLLQHSWLQDSMPKIPTLRFQDKDNKLLPPKIRKRNEKQTLNKERLIGANSPFKESDEFTLLDGIDLSNQSADQKLSKYREEEEDEEFPELSLADLKLNSGLKKEPLGTEDDPFVEIEEESNFVDPMESKMILSVETLVEKLYLKNNRLSEDLSELRKLFDNPKRSIMIKSFLRNHGLIRMLELLDSKNVKFVGSCLEILLYVFQDDLKLLENFCVIGGVNSVVEFINFLYSIDIRYKVVNFIELIIGSTNPIFQMFVASGGLKILNRLMEEDIESTPNFVICGINGINKVFLGELPTAKSDLCYLLKDSVDWLLINLSHLVDSPAYSDKIVSILQCFNSSEPRVKSYIASTTLFKSLFKNFDKLSSSNQLKILKFISSLSFVPSNLTIMDGSNCLEFLVGQLKMHDPSNRSFKEVTNSICPTIFNLCHLNKIRQLELVELGAIPIFLRLTTVELPFKDFIIPILSELVIINNRIRGLLLSNGVFEIFTSFLENPYWQVNSIDAIKNWVMIEPSMTTRLETSVEYFVKGFKICSNLNFLQNFHELIGFDTKICRMFYNEEMVIAIFNKLEVYHGNATFELMLLKVLKLMIIDNRDKVGGTIKESIKKLQVEQSSVLVNELFKEINDMIDKNII